MLTVDDCNTILKKYGGVGLWYEIDFSQFDFVGEEVHSHDFYTIRLYHGYFEITINTDLFQGVYYLKDADGQITQSFVMVRTSKYEYSINRTYSGDDFILCIYLTTNPAIPYIKEMGCVMANHLIPLSPTKVLVTNGVFDDKFYITGQGGVIYTVDDTVVQLESDEKGTFIRLPYANECIIGYKLSSWGINHKIIRITFKELKTLPIIYIPTLYRGTPQSVQVLNTEDDDPISDYQTYYQGRTLKDNTIQLPYDSDEYVGIMVDLKDYRYPFCTLKLKAPTTIYQAGSQDDVETAIENGIQTLQVGDTETEVTLNSITLSNVTLINSNIQVSESILTDCQIIDTTYTDNGGNNITNTIFNSVDYTNTAQSNYNEVTFTECDIHDSEINLTGTISKSTITDSLILSDGVINIQDNTFTGVGLKEYFPSHLYLTGDYTVTGNTFTLTGEWTELEYNMCIIKATNDFNPSNFIKQNNLQLNITYEDEPVNTFYYNLVDEDKIRAVKLQ